MEHSVIEILFNFLLGLIINNKLIIPIINNTIVNGDMRPIGKLMNTSDVSLKKCSMLIGYPNNESNKTEQLKSKVITRIIVVRKLLFFFHNRSIEILPRAVNISPVPGAIGI
jgi:hypothetical protein